MAQASFAVRRANPRYAFFAEAEATLGDGTAVPAQVSELSSRGCYIDTLEPIPIGTEVRLRISNGTSSCEVPGKVIYMHSGYGMGIFGMGVVFGNVPTDQLKPLNDWLRDLALRKTAVAPC
jgi:PilZ domain